MIHTTVGVIGHVSVCTAFVASLLAAYGYIQSQHRTAVERQSWMVFARRAFYLHSAAVLSVIISLFYIIYNHYYEYHYAWDHSSNNLPVHFMISCFGKGKKAVFYFGYFGMC